MGKNVVYPYMSFNDNYFKDEHPIKKLSLFYDSIYIEGESIQITNNSMIKDGLEHDPSFIYDNKLLGFLHENNIITYYQSPKDFIYDIEDPLIKEIIKLLNTETEDDIRSYYEDINSFNMHDIVKVNELTLQLLSKKHDAMIRLDTMFLNSTSNLSEYYPSLKNRFSFDINNQSKKEEIIQFILSDIPEIDISTSWEHIIEYRSDTSVRNKYLALINWVNKASNSNLKLSELKDEYDYLYSEYMQQFKLHKIKYNNSKLEILLNSTLNFVANIATKNYVSSIKDLFQFNIKKASLLQEESKIPGKEIAYIFHTKDKFGK
ncbi:hypothetical protein HZQ27_08160 [Elizabethkingia anophelis]|nr:hypothetical protein [Elizabethkingia anophelis]